jgi:glucose-1-phosphate thymidylyltransferase
MKGIILAGGHGTRLHPITLAVSKQLLPVYNKPMIFYPLATLMLAKIREFLVITMPRDKAAYQSLLKDGSQWGIKIEYATQAEPRGLAEAFIIGEKFIGNDSCCLILGDNIIYKDGLQSMLQDCTKLEKGAIVLGYHVSDPERYGVIEFDGDLAEKIAPHTEIDFLKVKSIEEKPIKPKSNYASIGLYFYDNQVAKIAKQIQPSSRGELEITSINEHYMKEGTLRAIKLGRGTAWLDMGTHESLLEASQFVQTIERRQGFKIADLREIAENVGFL